jgi:hypothetical protein
VFIDRVGGLFDHCLFTIHVCLRRGLRRKGVIGPRTSGTRAQRLDKQTSASDGLALS